jgi:hypothetical protein
MILPDPNYTPGLLTVRNGDAALSAHPAEADRYATWLAACYRWSMPAIIGHPMSDDTSWYGRFAVHVPHFCDSIAIGILATAPATGGSVQIDCDGDAYYQTIELQPPDDLASTQWVWITTPYAAPAADGESRAIQLTPADAPSDVEVIITPGTGVEILSVIFRPQVYDNSLGSLP